MKINEEITAVILCGGKSSRMGFDKALLRHNNQFLLINLYNQLHTVFSTVLLVTNSVTKFATIDEFSSVSIIEDAYPEMGPLGGITSALEAITTDYVFVIACDMPEPDFNLIQQLCLKAKDNDKAQVILYESEGRLETLYSLYHRSCLPVFQQQLLNNQLRIRASFGKELLVESLTSNKSAFNQCFINLNTPSDYKNWSNSTDDKNGD